MKFNPGKCYVMSITNKEGNTPFYSLGGCILQFVKDTKYLGITIQDYLQWTTHISGAKSKANRTLGSLRRNLRHCPQELRQLAYFTLVRSKLEYACSIWDPYLAKDINLIEATQRRAARFVCNIYSRRESVTAMTQQLGWDTLQDRRKNSRLHLMHKIIDGRVAIPHKDYLTPASSRTRSVTSNKLRPYSTRTLVYKNSFFPRTIPDWNRTPDNIISELSSTVTGITGRD